MDKYQNHLSLYDKSYSEHKFLDYQLFMQLSINELTFTLFDSKTKTFIAFENYRFNEVFNEFLIIEPLKEIIATANILKNKYHSVSFTYINNRSTLIPKPLYKPNELKEIHQFNFSKQEEDIYFSDYLVNLSAYNIYSIPDYIVNTVKSIENISFHHFSSSLIESSIVNTKKNSSLSQVIVHILPQSFQLISIKNQTLELYNSFDYQTSEDFIYYIMFALEQLSIENTKATVRLTGAVDKNSTIYEMLYKYIQQVDFIELPNDFKYSYALEQLPKHYYHALFNQYLCE